MTATIEKVTADPTFYFRNVQQNREELIVGSDNGNLIVIPESDWNQMNETINLLMDNLSVNSLLSGHSARENGIDTKKYSFEEVFHDL
jgi:PHD/YefM family antitoxin component YafN of YafNO toxin-antitoxin module